MKEFAFICGGIDRPEPACAGQVHRLNVAGPDRNVNLRLDHVSRALLSNLPDLLVDLLELAAYVYCADQRASRGSERLRRAGEDWRRHLRFIVPVRCLDVWSSASVRQCLEAALGFLSDDTYEFEFVESRAPPGQVQLYFADLAEGGTFQPDEVVLFSGGVDSLAGTVDLLEKGKRLLLVGHHSAPKVVAIQKELVRELRRLGFSSKLLHVTVNVTNTGVEPNEPTQRSRSFLFASLAFVLARLIDGDRFTFYENGVVSLNLPIAADVLGARATRTTHPKAMRGFETLFALLVERHITIDTPFLWLTKKEVVERLVLGSHPSLLARSVSCVHPISWTRDVRHCGICSQCIDRRFAVLAADAEQHDVSNGYRVDLLMDDRAHENPDPAIAYVKFARTMLRIGREQFQSEFPPVSSSLHSVPGLSAAEVLDRVWDLHRRHAEGVHSVIVSAARRFADDLVRGRVAPGSLLSLCFARGRVDAVGSDMHAQTAAFIDRLVAPTCEFAVDEVAGRICFRGDYAIDGAGYRLVLELIGRHRQAKRRNEEVPYYWTADLAAALGIEETAFRTLRGRVSREVEKRLAVDLGVVLPNGLIENVKSKGYRLSPELREVSLADLKA